LIYGGYEREGVAVRYRPNITPLRCRQRCQQRQPFRFIAPEKRTPFRPL
jgi:hypothetical protein